jgi:hypothetical protein
MAAQNTSSTLEVSGAICSTATPKRPQRHLHETCRTLCAFVATFPSVAACDQ